MPKHFGAQVQWMFSIYIKNNVLRMSSQIWGHFPLIRFLPSSWYITIREFFILNITTMQTILASVGIIHFSHSNAVKYKLEPQKYLVNTEIKPGASVMLV